MQSFFQRGGLLAVLLFLAGTGPPRIAAQERPQTAEEEIRFTFWNLRNYLYTASPAPEAGSNRPKPGREQQAVTTILLEIRPDILGVCEMGSPAELAQLQAALKAGGLDLPHAEHVQGDDPVRHLALLSRFPIVARQPVTGLHYLLDQNEFPVQRGFLDVTVAVNPDYQIRLVGAHLKSRRDVPEGDQALMRRNEAHLLRRHLDGILTAAPDTNLLVYGDLNDTRDQPGVKALKGLRGSTAALTEIVPRDESGERWTYYYPEADEYSRIDFVLASRALLPEMREARSFLYSGKDWATASDHRAVTAVFHPDDKVSRPRTKKKSPPSGSP